MLSFDDLGYVEELDVCSVLAIELLLIHFHLANVFSGTTK